MKTFKQYINEDQIDESNFLKKTATALLGGAVATAGGAGLGVAAPHIRSAITATHDAIGDPVGGAEIGKARENAANKIGLFGSNTPASKRALYGAGAGLALSVLPSLRRRK